MPLRDCVEQRTGKVHAGHTKGEPITERGDASVLVCSLNGGKLVRGNELTVIVSYQPIKLRQRWQSTVVLVSPVLEYLLVAAGVGICSQRHRVEVLGKHWKRGHPMIRRQQKKGTTTTA